MTNTLTCSCPSQGLCALANLYSSSHPSLSLAGTSAEPRHLTFTILLMVETLSHMTREDTEALKLDQHGHRAGLGRGSPKLYGPQTAAFSSPLLGPACPTSAVGSRTQVQNAGLATPELGVPRQVTERCQRYPPHGLP